MAELAVRMRGRCSKCGATGPFRSTDRCPDGSEHDKRPLFGTGCFEVYAEGRFVPRLPRG